MKAIMKLWYRAKLCFKVLKSDAYVLVIASNKNGDKADYQIQYNVSDKDVSCMLTVFAQIFKEQDEVMKEVNEILTK